jgi:hypothetical protein
MKAVLFALALLAAGCTAAKPATTATRAPAEEVIVLPRDASPPGSMDFDWVPPEPPEQQAEATQTAIGPELVSNKNTRGRLFALPTRTP